MLVQGRQSACDVGRMNVVISKDDCGEVSLRATVDCVRVVAVQVCARTTEVIHVLVGRIS